LSTHDEQTLILTAKHSTETPVHRLKAKWKSVGRCGVEWRAT